MPFDQLFLLLLLLLLSLSPEETSPSSPPSSDDSITLVSELNVSIGGEKVQCDDVHLITPQANGTADGMYFYYPRTRK